MEPFHLSLNCTQDSINVSFVYNSNKNDSQLTFVFGIFGKLNNKNMHFSLCEVSNFSSRVFFWGFCILWLAVRCWDTTLVSALSIKYEQTPQYFIKHSVFRVSTLYIINWCVQRSSVCVQCACSSFKKYKMLSVGVDVQYVVTKLTFPPHYGFFLSSIFLGIFFFVLRSLHYIQSYNHVLRLTNTNTFQPNNNKFILKLNGHRKMHHFFRLTILWWHFENGTNSLLSALCSRFLIYMLDYTFICFMKMYKRPLTTVRTMYCVPSTLNPL